MKLCPKCSTPHEKGGMYCSRSCANSRNFSAETNEKKSKSNLEFYANFTADERKQLQAKKNLKYDFNAKQKKVQVANLKNSWNRPYEEMAQGALRKRLLHERNNKCEECGTSDQWRGNRLPLELEHIDGNNKNNKFENLKILCPNCHSQTPTFRGRNIKLKNLARSNPR